MAIYEKLYWVRYHRKSRQFCILSALVRLARKF